MIEHDIKFVGQLPGFIFFIFAKLLDYIEFFVFPGRLVLSRCA